jgi:hypothetical protein
MNEIGTEEADRRLFRAHLVTLHALVELSIKKGLFTREEFHASSKWFLHIFDQIDAIALKVANRDIAHPSAELQTLYDEIEKRLFDHG